MCKMISGPFFKLYRYRAILGCIFAHQPYCSFSTTHILSKFQRSPNYLISPIVAFKIIETMASSNHVGMAFTSLYNDSHQYLFVSSFDVSIATFNLVGVLGKQW